MPAYIVAEHDVRDQETYDKAIPIARDAIAAFQGRYLSSTTSAELIEGTGAPKRITILEFPDMEAAKRWYDSEQYREARTIRQSAATSRIILADGVQMEPGRGGRKRDLDASAFDTM